MSTDKQSPEPSRLSEQQDPSHSTVGGSTNTASEQAVESVSNLLKGTHLDKEGKEEDAKGDGPGTAASSELPAEHARAAEEVGKGDEGDEGEEDEEEDAEGIDEYEEDQENAENEEYDEEEDHEQYEEDKADEEKEEDEEDRENKAEGAVNPEAE